MNDKDASDPARWTVSTVYADMWVDPDDDPREDAEPVSDERSTLLDYLRRYRLTLEMKCAGLDAEQLARRSVPPSTMTLLGLVRHMAEVERSWFRRGLAAQDVPQLYCEDDRDGDFHDVRPDPAMVEAAWRDWRSEIEIAEQFVAEHPDLDFTRDVPNRGTVQLRDILVHMVEEYARHCGHADLLRERIDGRVGQ